MVFPSGFLNHLTPGRAAGWQTRYIRSSDSESRMPIPGAFRQCAESRASYSVEWEVVTQTYAWVGRIVPKHPAQSRESNEANSALDNFLCKVKLSSRVFNIMDNLLLLTMGAPRALDSLSFATLMDVRCL